MNNRGKWRFSRVLMGTVLPVLVLAAALLGARALIASKPDAARLDPGERAVAVEVMRVAPSEHTVEVEAMGTVIPARRVELRAQVGGRVMRRHPALEAGGRFAEGEALLEIEREDYLAALAETESARAQALLNEALEQQRQSVAADEWMRSGESSPDAAGQAIALREPHVEAARRAAVAAHEGVERARRNLERTVIRAPFDGMVLKAYAETGSMLAPQSLVAEIAGTAVFHVEAALPQESLGWLDADAGGMFDPPPAVRVTVSSGGRTVTTRAGRVIRLSGELTRPGLMAGVLIAVEDPLSREAGMLPLGAYARCVIEGRRLQDVFVLPRSALRDEGKIWVAGKDDRLEIGTPGLLWQGSDIVLLSGGLDADTRVITTVLPSAIPGMRLQVLATEGASE